MAGKTSFYYAIFKRLQMATNTLGEGTGHHDPNELAGGFSLRSPNDPNGIFKGLASNAGDFQYPDLQPGWQPLHPTSLVPGENPLYAILNASFQAPAGSSIPVNGQSWPVMPMFPVPPWTEFNTTPPRLIDALGDWIKDGKLNDTPKKTELTFDWWIAHAPPGWPNLPTTAQKVLPVLFVASKPGDDGRRHGDGGMPDVPVDHVPPDFWAHSQIFLGHPNGDVAGPAHLEAGEEYSVSALVGNVGNWRAGRGSSLPNLLVRCDAQAFNTVMSPGTPLPSLGNLDPASDATDYEIFSLHKNAWEVAGFRFDVSKVFQRLQAALATSGMDLGGATPAQWLAGSHPCVKVRVVQGEAPNTFPPQGGAPLTLDSSPRKDRHIAQRNLAPFGVTMPGPKPPSWKTFVVSQVGKGANTLLLEHGLPLDAFDVHVAVTRRAWEHYVAKTPGLAGFEPVREMPKTRPFPECVILRQVAKAAHLPVAPHEREPFIGMAVGIAARASRERPARLGDLSVVHLDAHRAVAGGFTLQLHDAAAPPR